MFKSEQKLEQEAEAKIGFLSDGFWYCTDGQRFYSRRMAITVQIEIDDKERKKKSSILQNT